jgi:HK97 family phage portal protein
MKWLDRLLSKQSKIGRVVQFLGIGQPIWSPRDYANFAKEAYQRNIIAYRCISLIAEAAASVPWVVYKNDKELTDHPLLKVLRRPNPHRSGVEEFTALYSFHLISGNGWLERVTDSRGQPVELYAHRSDRMKIVPGDGGWPMAYLYQVSGRPPVRFDVDPITGQSDMLHVKAFNPLDDWYGMSPLEACGMAVDSHNEATRWNMSLLQNGARPSGALKTEELLSDDRFERLKAELSEQYQGAMRAGRPMLLEGKMEWVQMMLSAMDLDWAHGKEISAREIAMAFNVPEQLVGVPGQQTYNNFREARLALYEDAVLPLLDQYAQALTNWFQPIFGDSIRIGYDEDKIPALAPRREAVWERVSKADFLTIEEKREALGYSPVPEQGTILVSAGMIPLEMAVDPPQNMEEALPGEEENDSAQDQEASKRARLARLGYGS